MGRVRMLQIGMLAALLINLIGILIEMVCTSFISSIMPNLPHSFQELLPEMQCGRNVYDVRQAWWFGSADTFGTCLS